MSNDCVIEVRQNGDKIELEIKASWSDFDNMRYQREKPVLEEALLDKMRSGRATQAEVLDAATKVSHWLQNPDLPLDIVLKLARIAQPDFKPSRLVFNVTTLQDVKARFTMANLPLELAAPVGTNNSYIMHNGVTSIVHLLPKARNPARDPGATTWPLRVLIVRSNPQKLGGFVSPALPLRDYILGLRPDLPANHIQVEVLTSEGAPDPSNRPTKQNLYERLKTSFHILVYLGHGDVREGSEDQIPQSVLELEDEQGDFPDPVDATQLAYQLHARPIPVVLLVGCMTAADPDSEIAQDILEDLPQWMRGISGTAQTLIDSQSGVQIAVGMRFKLENNDGNAFIKTFFRNLIKPENGSTRELGDVEAAVREARRYLNLNGRPLSWATPAVFRTLGSEPTFPFLVSPPVNLLPTKHQSTRTTAWNMLKDLNWSMRPPAINSSLYDRIVDALLTPVEEEMIAALRLTGSLLMPRRIEATPEHIALAFNKIELSVPVELRGSTRVNSLQGIMTESSGQARFLALEASPALIKSGYSLLKGDLGKDKVRFHIQNENNADPLPEGILFEAKVEVGSDPQTVYTMSLEQLNVSPATQFYPLSNAIIIPAP